MLCEGPLGCVIALHTDAANTRCALIRISKYLVIVTPLAARFLTAAVHEGGHSFTARG